MTEVLFERSVYEAEQGLLHSALAYAHFTQQLLQFTGGTQMAWIIGFIFQLYIDLDKLREAQKWLRRGCGCFDRGNPENRDLIESYVHLDNLFNGEEWKML